MTAFTDIEDAFELKAEPVIMNWITKLVSKRAVLTYYI